MKKILIQLDTDPLASVFDSIVAYDAGVDHILAYGGVTTENVQDLIYGAMFTRGGEKLKNTAIFIGGSQVSPAQEVMDVALNTFFGPVRVSVLLDANGCNTTAGAAVIKMNEAHPVAGKEVMVLAGTGPVGMRAAALLALEGATVTLSSRSMKKAQTVCNVLKEQYKVEISALALNPADQEAMAEALAGKVAVLTTGAPGALLLEEQTWLALPDLKVLADLNAVPPGGIGGLKPTDNAKERHGKICFGPLGIGGFKMGLHKAALSQLFVKNDQVLDAREVYSLGKNL
ncbi:MAG TPA: NADP-dependent methylenetetrahydromethanopterin/methylenetetrahydrofolate dehydrogenase [bacterium]|nr:NADP-dependent methylenetetrahydromethanopterin/methylenetetrahydrofolate dehydrogenase [bacterium]